MYACVSVPACVCVRMTAGSDAAVSGFFEILDGSENLEHPPRLVSQWRAASETPGVMTAVKKKTCDSSSRVLRHDI